MDILIPETAVAEKIVRSLVVYGFLLMAVRVAGRRQPGQLTTFDLVVPLIIGNVLQNAAIGSDNSLGGGLLGATVLVKHGQVIPANLDGAHMSMTELRDALLAEGIATMIEARDTILEKDGHVSIPRKPVPA